jgi:hypothetical protein
VCSAQDTCDALGACQPNHAAEGAACGNPGTGACDRPDTCDGSGNCLPRTVANATPCNDDSFCTVGDACQGGTCAPTGNRNCGNGLACNEGADACQCVGCLVNGQCFATGVANPANSCQICDPFRSATSFSAGADPFCGSCPRRWGAAVPVMGANAAENDFQPTMTSDLLRICFASGRPGGAGATDIWCASRSSATAAFSVPVNQTSVNATSNDREPSLSGDGQELFFTSNRAGGAGGFDLYRAPFVPAAGAFGTPEPLSGLNTDLSELGPDVAKDGLTLYYYATAGGPGPDIFAATRASRNSGFGPGVAVAGLATTGGEREPGSCPDQSFMTFCADIDGAFVLSGAERLPGGGFGPQSLLEVGLPGCGPTVLSDGSLLFHGGAPDGLYVAAPLR